MADEQPSAALPIDAAALEWARRYRAIDDQGQLWCIKCNERTGQLPHLCCAVCIAAVRRGLPAPRPRTPEQGKLPRSGTDH